MSIYIYIYGLYWGYIGIMEKKMETTKTGGVCVCLSIYIYIWIILGLYWDNGKENGNYQNGGCVCVYIYIYIYGLYWGYIGIMEKKMETTIS